MAISFQLDESLSKDLQPPESGELAALLVRAAAAALAHQAADPDGELTLFLTNDDRIRALNRQYLDHDAPTDVLSFPAGEVDPESGALYLGDVILSLERARHQAEVGGHPLADELQLLTVHGVLHLLGHDHGVPEEKALMWTAQAEILAGLGSSLTIPPETAS
jgi:probable rRNA maturation factor